MALSVVLDASVALASPQTLPAKDQAWNQVRTLTHRNVFEFIQRNQNCVRGEISKVNDDSIVVTPRGASPVTIQKEDIVRIVAGYWSVGVMTTVYSRQSSWSDIQDLGKIALQRPQRKLRVIVTAKAGQKYNGDLRKVTDAEIVLHANSGDISIAKADVSSVDFLQLKPLTSAGEYSWDELGPLVVFDPELYPRLFRLGDTMPVRLYDSSQPEDNSAITCRP